MKRPVHEIQVAATRKCTTQEGPGKRYAIWVQGCTLKCKGCFNPHFWNSRGGYSTTVEEIMRDILDSKVAHPDIQGVTFLGGEPFEQASELAILSRELQNNNLSVMVFTGYTMAELTNIESTNNIRNMSFLNSIDLLVDGRFERDKVDTQRPWVGSKNQKFHFLSNKYSPETLFNNSFDGLEINIAASGEIRVNGWARSDQLEILLEKL